MDNEMADLDLPTAVVSLRHNTVDAIVSLVEERRIVLVRAPPFSGKSTLASLVAKSLKDKRCININLGFKSSDSFPEFYKKYACESWEDTLASNKPTLLIIDEVQQTYAPVEENLQLWSVVKLLLGRYIKAYLICTPLHSSFGFDCTKDIHTCQFWCLAPMVLSTSWSCLVLPCKYQMDVLYNWLRKLLNRAFLLQKRSTMKSSAPFTICILKVRVVSSTMCNTVWSAEVFRIRRWTQGLYWECYIPPSWSCETYPFSPHLLPPLPLLPFTSSILLTCSYLELYYASDC